MNASQQQETVEKLECLLVVLIKYIPRSKLRCCLEENEAADIIQVCCMQGKVSSTSYPMMWIACDGD